MCGITGIIDLDGQREIDRDLLVRMNDVQQHRGPDDYGIHLEPGVGLGHRRLSIIDHSGGKQPLYNEDHSVVVVYNGEIYNFQSLRRELERSGHTFRSHCDTEVIVHAWEEWGQGCVRRFRGMFAFAVWDSNQQTVFLARDRLGIKPLFYAVLPNGSFVFASELKSLLAHPETPRTIEPEAVADYFAYGYIPEPRTIFKRVYKLCPGHVLRLKLGVSRIEPEKYWDLPFDTDHRITCDEAQEELIRRLRESVEMRMIADVPLGAFLSGGVDSSAVVAMMAGLSADPVNTCSIAFGTRDFDESPFAARVAERYSTDHYVEKVDPDDFDLIDKLAQLYDEPYADSSAMPTYRVCELARKRVTVALSGDGGDENLAGYRRYRWHMFEERFRGTLPHGFRRPVFGFLGQVYPKMDWAPRFLRAKTTFEAIARDSLEAYFHSVSILSEGLRQRLFTPAFRNELQGYHPLEVFRSHAQACPTDDALSQVQYLDFKTYLVGDILTKIDRASMAHSLEVRVPFLDHELVEWISGLPAGLKLNGREGKYVLKKSLEPHLSRDILYRPKMGFAVPLASWFRGPLRQRVRDALLGDTMGDVGFFDRDFLRKLIDEHQSGNWDHTAAIWSLLMFESFQRNILYK